MKKTDFDRTKQTLKNSISHRNIISNNFQSTIYIWHAIFFPHDTFRVYCSARNV